MTGTDILYLVASIAIVGLGIALHVLRTRAMVDDPPESYIRCHRCGAINSISADQD